MVSYLFKGEKQCLIIAAIAFLLVVLLPAAASGWSLKTHIWIAQQVINDVVDDGMVNIGGRNYPVSARVVLALRQHPDRYRMGTLGPDVFPDPIVGQTTTHPGVKGGWQTDQWLQHLLDTAETAEEVAFAYGFSAHAAGDIFAHTYVNAYAGDVFELTDHERSVELRHFTLEKYIEALTPQPHTADGVPIPWGEALGTPVVFVRNQLILNGQAASQNLKAKTGAHLAAMYAVGEGVKGLNKGTQKLIDLLADGAAEYYKKQYEFQVDLATGKQALQAAQVNLDIQLATLEAQKKVLGVAENGLREAQNIVEKNPELISIQKTLLVQQTKVVADLAAESVRVAADVDQNVGKLQDAVAGLRGNLLAFACNALFWPDAVNKCKENVKKANKKLTNLESQITGQKLRAKTAKEAAEKADDYRNNIKREVDRLSDQYDKALSGITNATFKNAIAASQASIKLQENVILEAKRGVDKAQVLQDKLAKELKDIDAVIDEIAKAVKRYNAITVLGQNWSKGIEHAADEYVKASHEAGIKMLNSSGKPLDDYKRWLSCYGIVFIGVPYQMGDAVCTSQDFLQNLKTQYDEAIDGLPPVLRWMVAPTREAKKEAMKKLQPEIDKAKFELLKFTTDKATAEFLMLLSQPETASRSKLNASYSSDESGKRLLRFQDVASIVEKDLKINNGYLSTEQFRPLVNSVTLAKLTLLEPAILNQVIADFTGEFASSYFGKEVYKVSNVKSTLLSGAIRSIDGNHQWQPYGLPYPRSNGRKYAVDSTRHNFGYNYYADNTKGFKIWTDPFLRLKVFNSLFPGPMLGALNERVELQDARYNFVECAQNPFPSTQNVRGFVAKSDVVCRDLGTAGAAGAAGDSAALAGFTNRAEYARRYCRCDTLVTGKPHWTVIASFLTMKSAMNQKLSVDKLFPDIHTEVWQPVRPNRYWTVMMATCTTRERAIEARNLAIIRKIAPDAFIWKPKYPWSRLPPPISGK